MGEWLMVGAIAGWVGSILWRRHLDGQMARLKAEEEYYECLVRRFKGLL